jgi:hypothetical protein
MSKEEVLVLCYVAQLTMPQHVCNHKDAHNSYEVNKIANTRIYKACVYMLSLLIMLRSECIDYVGGM